MADPFDVDMVIELLARCVICIAADPDWVEKDRAELARRFWMRCELGSPPLTEETLSRFDNRLQFVSDSLFLFSYAYANTYTHIYLHSLRCIQRNEREAKEGWPYQCYLASYPAPPHPAESNT